MGETADRKEIAILGGGPAALATAFYLTSQPDWQQRYRITVYQLGWRLGGKCASSRNAAANYRIEEHGIHLFGNFYNNTFNMLRDCYDEVDWRPDEPFTCLDEALIGNNRSFFADYHRGRWHRYGIPLPHTDDKPWELENPPPAEDTLLEALLEMIHGINRATGADGEQDDNRLLAWLREAAAGLARQLPDAAALSPAEQAGMLLKALARDPKHPAVQRIKEGFDRMLQPLRDKAELSDQWRFRYIEADFYATVLRGILSDGLLTRDIDSVDDCNYRDWLARHGASQQLLNSSLPQRIVNVCFHYPDGNSNKLAQMSASAYLTFLLRSLLAKGSAAYFFAAGTGETLIAPLYRVLAARGVRFNFFHKVTGLNPSAVGGRIDSFDCDIQATLKPDADGNDRAPHDYRPLETYNRLVGWPATPHYQQLVEGERLRAAGVDLESYWADWQPVQRRTIRHSSLAEPGEDSFDYLVLGLSLGAVPVVCPRLLDAPAPAPSAAWRSLCERVKTIQTQAFQIWLDQPLGKLGWDPRDYGYRPGERLVCATYNFPTTDLCDFTDLIPWEGWPDDNRPRALLYFCGPMEELTQPPFDDHAFPAGQHQRVLWTAVQYLRSINGVFPNPGSSPINPQGLDPEYLSCYAPTPECTGINRYQQQFYRANIDPTERYVLSVPDSVQARLAPWQSGYRNLLLCGDWTYNGLNIGSVEAAVMSGMLASLALTGAPDIGTIVGYDFMHPDARRPPAPLLC